VGIGARERRRGADATDGAARVCRKRRSRTDAYAGWEVHQLTAGLSSGGQVRASGSFSRLGQSYALESVLTARRVLLSADLVACLPPGLRRLLQQLQARGRVDVDLSTLARTVDGSWEFAGQIAFADVDLTLGVPVAGLRGMLRGDGKVEADGAVALEATLEIERALFSRRAAEAWKLRVRRRPGQRWVYLQDVRGQLCEGNVTGSARVDPESGDYELSLTLRDVDLSQFLGRAESETGPAETLRRGRLDGYVYVRGRGSDRSSREGGGRVRIRGGSFVHSPVLLAVAQARPSPLAYSSDAVDSAEVQFAWRGSELHLTRVDVQGRDLRLVGEGSWNLQSDVIDLLLVGAHPRNWPRLGVLSDLFELTNRELVQYRVTGTAAAPQVKSAPLLRLNEALRGLLERSQAATGESR